MHFLFIPVYENFGCNWTLFHSEKKRKLKILMHVSEATRVETRNRRLFFGLKLVKNSSAELCKHLCQSLDPNCLERVVTYWPRCNGRYVLCSVKFTLMYYWCSASLVYCPTRFDELDKIFLEAYLLGTLAGRELLVPKMCW